MKTFPCDCLVLVATVVSSSLWGQDPSQFPKPVKEHEFLQQFVGEWTSHSEASAGPGLPAFSCEGKMTSRMLGGFWVVSESKATVMGMTMQSIQTIGYSPEQKKYVGTWVDSMMNYLWKYEGTVDATGKILTLEAEGPNFVTPGKTAKFRDAYEFKSKDLILSTSSMQGEDGKWITFMTGKLERKK